MKNHLSIIIFLYMQLFITTSAFAENSSNLRNDLKVMLTTLKNNCSNIEDYHPYESAIEALATHENIRDIPAYKYNSIFGGLFLHFIKDDVCRKYAVEHIVKGVSWLNFNKIITKKDGYWSLTQGALSKALVYKFYETGDDELLNQAIVILKENYLERYSKSEYLSLTDKKRVNLIESEKGKSSTYYDPNSYYLATMVFVPKIGFYVEPEYLKKLFLKIQAFENQLIDSVIKPFDNVESATLRVLNLLLHAYGKNEEENRYWSEKTKKHINSLLARNFINQDSCNQVKSFYRRASNDKSNYTIDLLQWVSQFVKVNCTNVIPLDDYISSFLKRFPNNMFESGELKNEILRHAANDMWRYSSDYKSMEFCDEMERLALINDDVIAKVVNSKKYWNIIKSKNCQ